MKKIIIPFLLLTLSVAAFSQQTKSSQLLSGEDYLRKSKKQKTAAWVLLGGGALMTTGGYTFMAYEALQGDGFGDTKFNVARIMFYTGGIAMLASIPLFISAAENKGRAYGMSAGLKFENTTVINRGSFTRQSYPALAVKIKLGK